MRKFYPRMYKKDIYDINYELLKKFNIKCLIFDLDNTIALIDQDYVEDKCEELFEKLSKDFKIIIISNNTDIQRVSYYAYILKCDYINKAMKPLKTGYNKIIKKYKFAPYEVAIIGDQLVTDILLANRTKSYPVLVDPMGQKDLKITALNRFIENRILNYYKRKRIFIKGEYYE